MSSDVVFSLSPSTTRTRSPGSRERCTRAGRVTGDTFAHATGDGLEACGRLIHPAGPTLAILDWSMPGLEGPEVCRQIRKASLRMQPYLVILTSRDTA